MEIAKKTDLKKTKEKHFNILIDTGPSISTSVIRDDFYIDVAKSVWNTVAIIQSPARGHSRLTSKWPATPFNLMHYTDDLENKYVATFFIQLSCSNPIRNVAAYFFSSFLV